ncbi:MAG: hypothetical protein J7L92_00855 [Dehalococcoidia bacterium]|nr:hypothetical protein [Dehalococcoidia bacterium]
MDEEARRKMTRARSQLIMQRPWFGYLSCYLEPREDKNLSIPTMGTDGRYLYYCPDFVKDLSMEHLLGCICHEIAHVAFGDLWRRGGRDQLRWNVGADCVRNTLLLDEGFRLPSGLLMVDAAPDQRDEVRKLSVEEMYERVEVTEVPIAGLAEAGEGGGYEVETRGGKTRGKQLDDHDVWDKAGDGDKSEFDKSKARKELEQRWREYVSRARQIVKSQGKGMGSLDEMVDELLEARLDWRQFLRNFLLSTIISDYQICPPSKRHLWRGVYLPSVKREEEVEVIFAADTSGSMGTEELRDAISEVVGITTQFAGYRIWYVEVDWNIQRITELTPYTYNLDEIKKVRGRGGTRFPVQRIVSEVQNEHNGNPSAVIYFTDSFGDVEGGDPGLPVFWLVCQPSDRFRPSFGTVVKYER